MWWFHTRQFARNGYFVQLLLTTTIGMVALQALAARTPGAIHSELGWLRAGMIGTWTLCTVSAGMLGFQRFQGTLVHLMRSAHSPARVLMPVIGAASVFGLAALPIAAFFAWLFQLPVTITGLGPVVVAAVAFWLACLAISSVIGTLFVLTPNAMTYEGLIGTSLVLLSGVFGTPASFPQSVLLLTHILPTRSAVRLLFSAVETGTLSLSLLTETILVSAIWIAGGIFAARIVARRATVTGTLEMV